MAQIAVNFDTKSKDLSVSINGQKLADVSHISLYRGHDAEDNQSYVEIGVETVKHDEGEEMTTRTVYLSHGSKQADAAIADGCSVDSDIEGFIAFVDEESQFSRDVAEFMRTFE